MRPDHCRRKNDRLGLTQMGELLGHDKAVSHQKDQNGIDPPLGSGQTEIMKLFGHGHLRHKQQPGQNQQ
ncbi:hypothetical protein [Methylomonas aurea]|uniref:hypothetical protein n=1 Tax=Methylomonas aurea TaxID=2952224 RepID=UPI003531CA14